MTLLNINIKVTLSQFELVINEQLSLAGIIGLFGHSGAGKSSLLSAIVGNNRAITGQITLDNKPLLNSQHKINLSSHQRGIVGVFQQDCLFSHLTVHENILFGRKRLKQPTLDLKQIIHSSGLKDLLNAPISQLSGGERQRVSLVQALLTEPNALVLDEPLTALDRTSKRQLLTLIKRLHTLTQVPVIYVSHDIHEIQTLCQHLYVIEQGRITHRGITHQVIHQLNHGQLIQHQTSLTLALISGKDEHGLCQYTLPSGDTVIGLASNIHPPKKDANSNQTHNGYLLASDVSICTSAPNNSSIVNQLQGYIDSIEQQNEQVLITINCNKQLFFATISSYSLEKLALYQAQSVYIQFKAGAIKLLN